MNFYQNFIEDVDESFIEKCIHLHKHLNREENKKISLNNFCSWIRKNGFTEIYNNVNIALRIFKCTAVTNCTAERSFSCLFRIKNYLRSNMSENRLNDLSILSIENDVLNT